MQSGENRGGFGGFHLDTIDGPYRITWSLKSYVYIGAVSYNSYEYHIDNLMRNKGLLRQGPLHISYLKFS